MTNKQNSIKDCCGKCKAFGCKRGWRMKICPCHTQAPQEEVDLSFTQDEGIANHSTNIKTAPQEEKEHKCTQFCKVLCEKATPAPQEKKWYNISDKLKEEVENSPLLDFDTQEESWEEQLEELNKKHGYHMTDMGPARWEVLKNFISNLLQKAREEGLADGFYRGQVLGEQKSRQQTLASLRERIEGMKKEIRGWDGALQTDVGYNQALQDIIHLIEELNGKSN